MEEGEEHYYEED